MARIFHFFSSFHKKYIVTNGAITLVLIFCCFFTTSGHTQRAAIPTPEEVIGFEVGSDFHLVTYEQSMDYFKKLAAASDFVEMKYAGKTSEGRDWQYVLISSPENIKNIEKYKAISQQLAHPEGLTREAAKKLASEG